MEIRKDVLLHADNYDYIDHYEYVIMDLKNKIGILEIAETFVKPGPKWFEGLFALRHKIASIFKLKTPAAIKSGDDNYRNKWEAGARAGIFKVFSKTETEIILGEDDRHLDLRISLLLNQHVNSSEKKVTVSTMVKYNNNLGRIYFFVVKPFHRAIIPVLLKKNFKKLELEVNS